MGLRSQKIQSLEKNLTELTSSRSTFNFTFEKFESISCDVGRVPHIKICQPLHLRGQGHQQRVREVAVGQSEPLNVTGALRSDVCNASLSYSINFVIISTDQKLLKSRLPPETHKLGIPYLRVPQVKFLNLVKAKSCCKGAVGKAGTHIVTAAEGEDF